MIKKLRQKFILVTMFCVTLILLCVFIIIGISTYQRSSKDIQETLQRTLSQTDTLQLPDFKNDNEDKKKPHPMTPSFRVELNHQKEVTNFHSPTFQVSNTTLTSILEEVFQMKITSGKLKTENLQFLMKTTSHGYVIAFGDLSGQDAEMQNLMITSLLVGSCSFAAFFILSYFLSSWALKPVAQAWQKQRQFVADASHELKTPLTIILADTDILLAHPQHTIEHQRQWVTYIKTEAERMKKLVEDLLFLAKSDNHHLEEWQRINLSDLTWNCVLPFESIAFEQGLHLHSEIEDALFMRGDEQQIKQLIMILIDNACKYASRKSRVHICLKKNGDKIKFSIHNIGNTIPSEDLNHIFERFYRADKARVYNHDSFGLGLSIAQSIVEKHHGKLEAQSSEEDGTTFIASFHAH